MLGLDARSVVVEPPSASAPSRHTHTVERELSGCRGK